MKDDNSIAKVLSKLDDLTREVKVLRSDVSSTKSDVALMHLTQHSIENSNKAIQTDISDLKTDIHGIENNVADMKSDIHRIEVLSEHMDAKIDHVIEVVVPIGKEVTKLRTQQQKHDDTLQFQDRRISFLEKKIA
jgi:chromosome segregation ATPase